MNTQFLGFPQDFIWGTATAAYQIEGAATEDGREPSIWDTFSHTPGKTKNGDTGDVACDHYHRYAEDLDLMRDLGIQSYRFSLAWPRIMPAGRGPVNQQGLDFYKRLVDGLRQRNIRPMATLYHWDLPQALQDQGGWASRETAYRFAEYADQVFRALGGDVRDWITHNEPWVVAFIGNYQGRHAPGLHDLPTAVKVSHHLLLSHGLATQAFRALGPDNGQIGITLNLTPAYPATESAPDKAAAWLMDGHSNRWFLDPIFRGSYPQDVVDLYAATAQIAMDYVQPDDLKLISAPLDFLGINYYFPHRVAVGFDGQSLPLSLVPALGETSIRGWEVAPNAFYDLVRRVNRDYGSIPIYITENGAAFADTVEPDGQIDDAERLTYIHTHLSALHQALAAGVPLKGYYAWSLLDNFEWGEGYDERFGLVRVDFTTQRRTPKRSALWYKEVIRHNGLVPLPAELEPLSERYFALEFNR